MTESTRALDSMHYIWCPDCVATQRLITDYLPGHALSPHAAIDLVCAECHFIVATLHEADK